MLRKSAQLPLEIGRIIYHNTLKFVWKEVDMDIGNKIFELRKQKKSITRRFSRKNWSNKTNNFKMGIK